MCVWWPPSIASFTLWKQTEAWTLITTSISLDPDNDLDLFVLHCVYLSRINEHLHLISEAWNNHPEHNWTQLRMWTNGMLDPQRQDLTAVRDPTPDTDFGVNYCGPLPAVFDAVEIPETPTPLRVSELQEYVDTISCIPTKSFGIDVFAHHSIISNLLAGAVGVLACCHHQQFSLYT